MISLIFYFNFDLADRKGKGTGGREQNPPTLKEEMSLLLTGPCVMTNSAESESGQCYTSQNIIPCSVSPCASYIHFLH